jgi:hypothetical protein
MTRSVSKILCICLVTLPGVNGCITTDQLKTATSGHTGCTPEQITISNRRFSGGGELWDATCNGKVYLCSLVSTGKSSDEYSCALAQ